MEKEKILKDLLLVKWHEQMGEIIKEFIFKETGISGDLYEIEWKSPNECEHK